jgi:hypothetical protein
MVIWKGGNYPQKTKNSPLFLYFFYFFCFSFFTGAQKLLFWKFVKAVMINQRIQMTNVIMQQSDQ